MSLIDKIWFKQHPLRWCLTPFSLLFYLITLLRRLAYGIGIKKSVHPGVPVLIVGNISVGGNGKTPVVLKTVEWLVEFGFKPGILSRGYGGSCQHHPHQVSSNDNAELVGDEPKLMALRDLCPVVIDPVRTRGAAALTDAGCNIIVCDDGLQHYALARDIEWVVMDDRAVGNGWLLPAGPLRELPSRLSSVHALIHNGTKPFLKNAYTMQLKPTTFINVANPSEHLSVAAFTKRYGAAPVSAIAGIGAPERFFTTLNGLGITPAHTRAFIDHHAYSPSDLPQGLTLMTEKDAVKCSGFAHSDCWYLQVSATLPDKLKNQLAKQLIGNPISNNANT